MKKTFSMIPLLILAHSATAEIRFIYPPKKEAVPVEKVAAIKNSYEVKEQELFKTVDELQEAVKRLEEQRLADEKAKEELVSKNKKLLAEKAAKEKSAKAKAKEIARIKELKEKRLAMERSKKYSLAVDNTKLVITQIGTAPDALPALYSEGFDTAAIDAFDSIIPIGWKLYMNNSLHQGKHINWDSKGENWLATLYNVGLNHNYMFDVNWDQKWVLVNESDMRTAFSDSETPEIIINKLDVPEGSEGIIIIDGKVMKVKAAYRN